MKIMLRTLNFILCMNAIFGADRTNFIILFN